MVICYCSPRTRIQGPTVCRASHMSPSDGNSRDVGGGCIFQKRGPSEPQGEHLNPGHPNAQRARQAGEETTPLPPGCLTHSTVSCSGKSSSPASWPRQGQPCAFHTLPVAPSSLWRAEGWSWMPEGRLYPPSEVGKPSSTGRTAGCLAQTLAPPYGSPQGYAKPMAFQRAEPWVCPAEV